MKKKVLCLVMAAMLSVGMLVGCGSGDTDTKDDTKQETQDDKKDDAADAADKDDASGSSDAAADGEITDTITLSGTYYSGQVIITLKINPDGTVEGDANGEEMEGTWKMSDKDGIYIEATGKAGGNEMNFEVSKADGGYTATVDLVSGMVLNGK